MTMIQHFIAFEMLARDLGINFDPDVEWDRFYEEYIPRPAGSIPQHVRYDI